MSQDAPAPPFWRDAAGRLLYGPQGAWRRGGHALSGGRCRAWVLEDVGQQEQLARLLRRLPRGRLAGLAVGASVGGALCAASSPAAPSPAVALAATGIVVVLHEVAVRRAIGHVLAGCWRLDVLGPQGAAAPAAPAAPAAREAPAALAAPAAPAAPEAAWPSGSVAWALRLGVLLFVLPWLAVGALAALRGAWLLGVAHLLPLLLALRGVGALRRAAARWGAARPPRRPGPGASAGA